MGLFGAAHRWGPQKVAPLLKIFHTYPTVMKLGTVIPCLKKAQEIYESPDTHLELSGNTDKDCILVHNI